MDRKKKKILSAHLDGFIFTISVFCLFYFEGIVCDRLHTASTFSSSRILLFFFFFCPHLLTLGTDFTVVNSVCTVHTLCIYCSRIKKY